MSKMPEWIDDKWRDLSSHDHLHYKLKEALRIAWEALELSDFYLREGKVPIDIHVARQAISRIRALGEK